MGEAGAVIIAFMLHEHLGFMLQPPKTRRMDDAVAVALVAGAGRAFLLGPVAAPAGRRLAREGRARRRGKKRPHEASGRRLGHRRVSDYITPSVVNLKFLET